MSTQQIAAPLSLRKPAGAFLCNSIKNLTLGTKCGIIEVGEEYLTDCRVCQKPFNSLQISNNSGPSDSTSPVYWRNLDTCRACLFLFIDAATDRGLPFTQEAFASWANFIGKETREAVKLFGRRQELSHMVSQLSEAWECRRGLAFDQQNQISQFSHSGSPVL